MVFRYPRQVSEIAVELSAGLLCLSLLKEDFMAKRVVVLRRVKRLPAVVTHRDPSIFLGDYPQSGGDAAEFQHLFGDMGDARRRYAKKNGLMVARKKPRRKSKGKPRSK